ncbi:MAG: type II secretion system protein GspG [bacterium (Candidatus Ratteibacteria) CG15_BIG_FIL_POST_REV_8_21_14_020_41_12]|uniref:Type II secretion system core protein G n=1 Tax=bacterium (Candidatus Ratteibacteria) CG15_BIG_FIL_POST_REV_8_21_14_020_41_12 TaxID=2014291 RepID=A0A2M7GWL6_9BACT|nr:MAG: type II secretion system protein GspG [bacterium (Candidatus Ratteibacteria) CG15_BIG_FIL_POST_REV_8_21_14_020_41_12]
MRNFERLEVWKKAHHKYGFTLIELMVVLIILSTLAMLVMPKIFGRVEDAKRTAAMVQIKNFEMALRLFYLDNGFYPDTEQGLDALVKKPTFGRVPEKWREDGYLEKGKVPWDPWRNPYIYISPGINNKEYDIISYGRDGEEGGESADKDIENWNLEEAR